MAKKKLTGRQFTIIGPKGWERTTFSVLSCVFKRRSPGTDADTGEVGGSLLLVGDGRQREGLGEPMRGVY